MARLHLVAASDDYLLEESLRESVAEISTELPGVSPEILSDEISPESLAVEICSPSLFDPQRLLVVNDVRPWLETLAPVDAPRVTGTPPDVSPLVRTLAAGLPEGVAVVLGAWCARKPRGDLVKVIEEHGRFLWTPLPETPKPWEEVLLSDAQKVVLRKVVSRAAGERRLSPAAEDLLLERLGFAPRLLFQEVDKLVTAAGEASVIDEQLVRRLVFPRERSLEVVRDAVMAKNAHPLLDIIAAAANGLPVRNWQGQRLESGAVPPTLFGQIYNLLHQMLFLRRVAAELGLEGEMEPAKTRGRGWYGRSFKNRLGPEIVGHLSDLGNTPLGRGPKPISVWALGQLFAAAGHFSEHDLVAALAESGTIEAHLRGPSALESLTSWVTPVIA